MVTIYDIAKKAGVSPSSVSNAFNRPDQLGVETRERILAVADSLGYRPNLNAQALARGKSALVGILAPDIRNPHVATIARGIEDRMLEAGYMPIIASTDGHEARTIELMNKLEAYGACGFILIPEKFGISPMLDDVLVKRHKAGMPIVIGGHDVISDTLHYISMQGQKSAAELTTHLIEFGHTNIAYLGGYSSKGQAIRRWLGFQQAMLQHGVTIRHDLMVETDATPRDSFSAMSKLMALPNPPTAIFAQNDVYVRGVIDYVSTHHIAVPEELSFVTYDYQVIAQRTTPHVTCISIPTYDIGFKSADLFLSLLETPDQQQQHFLFDYTLEQGETCGKPKAHVRVASAG